MNSFFRLSFLFVAVLGFAGGSAALRAAPRTPAAKHLDHAARTKNRIDDLLKFRLNPDTLPANLANPFQLPAGTKLADLSDGNPSDRPVDAKIGPTEPVATDSDSEALARYAAGLKITGTVKVDDQVHLVINQAPYKVGDLLRLNLPFGPVHLQIIGIAPGELTIGLNQAVQTIKFKN